MEMAKLDQRIEFITEGYIGDGAGGSIPKRSVALYTYAKIEQLKQSRRLDIAIQNLPAVFFVTIYYREVFTPTTKTLVKWRGKMYKIISTPTVDDTRLQKHLNFNMQCL